MLCEKIVSRQRQGEKRLKELLCLPVTETGVCQRTALTNWKKQKNRKLPPGNCCCGEERKKNPKTMIKIYQEVQRMDGQKRKTARGEEIRTQKHHKVLVL